MSHAELSWPLNYLLSIVSFQLSFVLIVNNCYVHVLYKIIFSNKFDLFWTRTLFLYSVTIHYGKRLVIEIQSSLLGLFVSYVENEVLRRRFQEHSGLVA